MIIQTITRAKAAAITVEQTKNAIRDVCGIRNSPTMQHGLLRGGHSDPVFVSVQVRDKLTKKLKQQQAYAVKCYDQMIAVLDTIPDPVTRKIFYDRYYLSYSWEQVAKSAGIGVSAAKMRHKRHLDQAHVENAA